MTQRRKTEKVSVAVGEKSPWRKALDGFFQVFRWDKSKKTKDLEDKLKAEREAEEKARKDVEK